MDRLRHSWRLVLLLAAVLAALVIGVGVARSASVSPPPDELVKYATETAAYCGDAAPMSAEYALTTAASAAALVGLTPGEYGAEFDKKVYVVVLHGSFVLQNARVPVGAAPPKGEYVVFTLDPATWSSTDLHLGSSPPDTSGMSLTPFSLQ